MSEPSGNNLVNTPWPMFLHDAGHTNRSNQAGPTTLRLAWGRQVSGQWAATTPIIDQSGNIFVYFYGGLYCFDASGNIKGSYTGIQDGYSAIGLNDNIYIFGFRKVAALEWTGAQFNELWVNTTSVGQNWAAPTIGPDGTIYIVCTNSSIPGTDGHGPMDRVVAIDPITGAEKWHVPMGGFSMSSPALDAAGNIYFGCDDGKLYSVSSTGVLRWSLPTNGRVCAAPVIDEDGIIYINLLKPPTGQGVVALNSSGNTLWNYPEYFSSIPALTYDDMNPFATPALGPDGLIYTGLENELHALTWDGSSKYAQARWIRQLDPGDRTAYLTVDKNGSLYFTTFQQKFYALDPDGGLIWKLSPLPLQQPVIAADGRIYVAGGNTLYALSQDDDLPAALETIWSDLQNSARPGGQGNEIYYLNSGTFTDPAVWQMVSAAIGATGMDLNSAGQGPPSDSTFADIAVSLSTPADGLTQSNGEVILKGIGVFGGAAASSVEFVFGVEGNDVTLDFSVAPGNTWKLSSTFAPLAKTFFSTLNLTRAHLSQSATTSQAATQWQFDASVSFSGPLAPAASITGDAGVKNLHGTISFENDLPILDLTIGVDDSSTETFAVALAPNLSLDITVALRTSYQTDYESLASQIVMNSSISVGGHSVAIAAEILPAGGLAEFSGTYSQPPTIPLSALDIWGGDEDMQSIIPPSMQSQSPAFALKEVGLWLLTDTKQVTAFTARLDASNWQAIASVSGVTNVTTGLTSAELIFAAFSPFDDDRRNLDSYLTGEVDINVATLMALAKAPDFPILGAQAELETSLSANQILTGLVAQTVTLPHGFPDAQFNTAELSAVSNNGNVYYRFTTDTVWPISCCVSDLNIENIGLSVEKVHTSPTTNDFEMAAGIFGTVTIADAVFGIGGYNPESGNIWRLDGPVTLPIYLPAITDVVLYFNSQWNDALPAVLASLGEDYEFSCIGIAFTEESDIFFVVLATPSESEPWIVIAHPFEIQFATTELVLTCDPDNDDTVDGFVRGPFEVGEGTIYLKSDLPFNPDQYAFNIDNDPPVQDPEAVPAPMPSVADIVALVNQSWSDNLPPALLDLENNIAIATFTVDVNGQTVQAIINLSAADAEDSWQIIAGPPRFAINRLKIALIDSYDGSSESSNGTVSGTLPVGESSLPMQTALTDDWSGFTVSLDRDALASMESAPALADIVSLFDPSWPAALSSDVLSVESDITIDNFDLAVASALRTAGTRIESPSSWPGWSPLSNHSDIKLSEFELDLSYSQPGGEENPSGRMRSSINIFDETTEVVQVLPSTKLAGRLSRPVPLQDIVHYLTGQAVPDYMQNVQIMDLLVQIDPTTQTLTIDGVVAEDITIPRNDEEEELGECEGEYPEPPDSVLKNGRLHATSSSVVTVCITGDFMWNTGIEVPGQSCYPFTDFVPSLAGAGSNTIPFPPPVDPTNENPVQVPELDTLVSDAQAIMDQGLGEADAVFLLSQQQGLSPQQSIQTLFELSGSNLQQLPTLTTEFTDIYPGYGCDPEETTEDVVEALEDLPAGPVAVTPELMTVALIAAFPGITAAAIAAALIAAGLTPPPSLPGSGSVSCADVAADLAASGYQPADAALVLVSLAQCEAETGTAAGLAGVLSAAYPAMTLAELASALAAVGFAAADVAPVLVAFAAAAGIVLSAVALAGLLVAVFGVIFTPVELAGILVVCGFPPTEVILVFIAEPPLIAGIPTTAAGLAALLGVAFGTALACSDLADSLALTPCELISVTTVLRDTSSLCGDETGSAEAMAELLFAAYGDTITCADLANALAAAGYSADEVAPVIMQNSPTLCTGQPQSAQDLADLLNSAYTNPSLTLLELAAVLAAAGFAAAVVAEVITQESESEEEPGTAEDLAELLEDTYGDSLTCSMLADALADAGFTETDVALALKSNSDACASQTSTALGMSSLLLGAYPSISCQEMANALAACEYPPDDVSLVLAQSVPACSSQSSSADAMAAILLAAYTDPPITCDQLAGALGAVQYSVTDVAIVLTQSPYNSLCGTEIRTAVGMADLLIESYPSPPSCTTLGDALAAAGYAVGEVAYVLSGQSCACQYPVVGAANMAVTLGNIYRDPMLTCEQLAQALALCGYPLDDIAQVLMDPSLSSKCSQQTSSAEAFGQLLYDAYPAHNLSPDQMTEALASVGFPANEVAPVLRSLFPNSTRTAAAVTALLLPNYPKLTCSQLAAALAATPCDIVQTAQALKQQATLCGGQTQTADEMATLLNTAFGSALTCRLLASALAATNYSVDDVAVVVTQSSTVLCSGQPQSANDLAMLLVSVYLNPPLTCAQLAEALASAGYCARQIAVVLTQQPPICLDQPENAAALAYLLQHTFTDPALSCTDLAAALAAVAYGPSDVAIVLRADSSACSQQTATAADMAALLLGAYGALTCQQLGAALAHSGYDPISVALVLQRPPAPNQTLCSGETDTAADMASLIQTCFAGVGVSAAQMAQALAACGFAATDVSPIIYQLYPGSTTLAYYMAALLLGAYADMTCSSLASALAAVPYDPDDVASVLLQPPPPYTTLCSDQTSTASGMAALLTAAYPSLTCQQLALALAGAQYDVSDVAVVLKAESACSSQTATASGMASLLDSVFTNPPLTCDQLAMALGACAYSPTDVAQLLKQEAICSTETQTASGMATLLLESYSNLTCIQLADALATTGYDPSSVAVTLRYPPNNAQLCADDTQTAGEMTAILQEAYDGDLSEDQLQDALIAAGYPQEEINDVIQTIYGAGGIWTMYLCNARHTARSNQPGPSALNIAWQESFSHAFNGIAVDALSNLYFGTSTATTENARIYCADSSGNTVWYYDDFSYSGPLYTPAIGADGTIYGANGQVFAVRPAAGQQVQSAAWHYNPYNDDPTKSIWSTLTPLTIGPDGTIYAIFQNYSNYNQNILAAINPDGTKKWWYTIPVLASSPAIAPDGTIILALQNGQIYRINPANGSATLLYNTGTLPYGSGMCPPAIRADGVIFVLITGSNGQLLALTPDGTRLWSYSGGTPSASATIGIREDGVIYAGFNYLHAVTEDGVKLWQSTQSGYPRALAVGSNGNVYFGVESSGPSGLADIYALDANGNTLWSYEEVNSLCAPAIGPDGTVYFSDRYANLIAASP